MTFSPKIVLLGSGQIGGNLGLLCGLKKLSNNIVMLDICPDMPKGKALDMAQGFACEGINCTVTGSSDITENSEGLEGADVVIVTAGVPRKPGMSRDDLLSVNAKIVTGVATAIKAKCPGAFVVCITNPLDVMVSLLQKVSGLPPSRVVGMAGMLDSARFKYFLGEAMGVNPADINTMVLGGHGDAMVPMRSLTSVNGIPLTVCVEMKMITEAQITAVIERTRQGGGEIVSLLKNGSAFVAPAFSAIRMVEAYLRNERSVMPCCAYLNGEYGVTGIYTGVPVIIGSNGVEKVLQVPFSCPKEKQMFDTGVEHVQELREACNKLGFAI